MKNMTQEPRQFTFYPAALDRDALATVLVRIELYEGDVGVGLFYLQATNDTLMLGDIQVRSDLRRQGRGGAALMQLVELARASGYARLIGFIQGTDLPRAGRLSRFYDRNGFTVGEPGEDGSIALTMAL